MNSNQSGAIRRRSSPTSIGDVVLWVPAQVASTAVATAGSAVDAAVSAVPLVGGRASAGGASSVDAVATAGGWVVVERRRLCVIHQ
jgi:hypothetical protein